MIIDPAKFRFERPSGFIALEGVNGAGKTSLQESIAKYFEARGKNAVRTREPGATELGKNLRKILLEHSHGALSPLTEVFLFAADRAQHVSELVRPALSQNNVVITDRYFYSTMAFQGYGRGLSVPMIEQVNHAAVDYLLPDLVILLDLDPAEGLRRTKGRDQGTDNFEREELAFHQRLRAGFLDIASKAKEPFLVVDASMGPEEVFTKTKPVLDALISSLKVNS